MHGVPSWCVCLHGTGWGVSLESSGGAGVRMPPTGSWLGSVHCGHMTRSEGFLFSSFLNNVGMLIEIFICFMLMVLY